ncbi:MAG: HIT domain-containing protein, partial [Gammaproteobacteria bacterium]|nr:HIT domain-containing protein [Gammaproteobacteria bacterium]NIR95376.1 HIT domain-containing protein [Gammaproteobacteria bacterium]
MFKLHPQLARDTIVVGDFPLCRLLLMNDLNYPWFILVPRRAGVKEIFEMAKADQLQLLRESSHLSETMQKVFQADK